MSHPVPDAIDFLYDSMRIKLDDWQVIDGPPIVELGNKGLTIGFAPDRLSVETEKPTEGAAAGGLGGGDGIRFDINCMTWFRTGDSDMKMIRDQVYLQLATIDEFVQAHRRLGGAVTRAHVRLVDYDQLQTTEDSWGTAAFTVTCNAFH